MRWLTLKQWLHTRCRCVCTMLWSDTSKWGRDVEVHWVGHQHLVSDLYSASLLYTVSYFQCLERTTLLLSEFQTHSKQFHLFLKNFSLLKLVIFEKNSHKYGANNWNYVSLLTRKHWFLEVTLNMHIIHRGTSFMYSKIVPGCYFTWECAHKYELQKRYVLMYVQDKFK